MKLAPIIFVAVMCFVNLLFGLWTASLYLLAKVRRAKAPRLIDFTREWEEIRRVMG